MKKFLVVAVAVSMVLMAASAFAAIVNSKHDLSNSSTASVKASNSTLSACQFCHTPHNGAIVGGAPLWNRALGTTSGYQIYTTGTFTLAVSLGANSLTCLSCHDGTVSLGNVLVGTAATFAALTNRVTAGGLLDAANKANLTTDLRNDHPIGFAVDVTRGGLDSIANMQGHGAKFYGATNTMECATCHDPHNTTNVKFLRMAIGTMCTDCHVNK